MVVNGIQNRVINLSIDILQAKIIVSAFKDFTKTQIEAAHDEINKCGFDHSVGEVVAALQNFITVLGYDVEHIISKSKVTPPNPSAPTDIVN